MPSDDFRTPGNNDFRTTTQIQMIDVNGAFCVNQCHHDIYYYDYMLLKNQKNLHKRCTVNGLQIDAQRTNDDNECLPRRYGLDRQVMSYIFFNTL